MGFRLRKSNWNGLKSNNFKVGQRLTIYPKGANLGAQGENTAMAKTENPKPIRLKVDTYGVSKKFPNVSVEDLKKWNDISGNNLKSGNLKLRFQKANF
ncbi:MAG: LysM peptidoglycan-binding domain-containing protein [Flavobacteriaceae bacterium]